MKGAGKKNHKNKTDKQTNQTNKNHTNKRKPQNTTSTGKLVKPKRHPSRYNGIQYCFRRRMQGERNDQCDFKVRRLKMSFLVK